MTSVARTGDLKNVFKILVGNQDGRDFGRTGISWTIKKQVNLRALGDTSGSGYEPVACCCEH